MSTMTIRMQDDKLARIKQLARARKISVNKLIEDLATAALVGHEAEVRFRAIAAMGNPARALKILDRLDASEQSIEAVLHCQNSFMPKFSVWAQRCQSPCVRYVQR